MRRCPKCSRQDEHDHANKTLLTDREIHDALKVWPPSRKTTQPDYTLVAAAQHKKTLAATLQAVREELDAPLPEGEYPDDMDIEAFLERARKRLE